MGKILSFCPFYLLGFRFFTGGVVLGLVFIKKLLRAGRDVLIHGAVLGVVLFVAMAFQTYGCKYTTAGKNAFITTIFNDKIVSKNSNTLKLANDIREKTIKSVQIHLIHQHTPLQHIILMHSVSLRKF